MHCLEFKTSPRQSGSTTSPGLLSTLVFRQQHHHPHPDCVSIEYLDHGDRLKPYWNLEDRGTHWITADSHETHRLVVKTTLYKHTQQQAEA